MTGLLSRIGGWLGDDTNRMRLAGASHILGALDQGQAPNVAPFLGAIQEQKDAQAFRDSLGSEDMMSRFSEEERSFLAGLPPQVAQKFIAERMFATPDPWAGTKVVGSRIVRMGQGGPEVVGDYSDAGQDPSVQSSALLDDGTSVMVMRDGSRRVVSPTGEELTGQAAADAIKAARDYTVSNQRDIYGGRREGTLGADIALGGEAASAVESGKIAAERGQAAFEAYQTTMGALGNIDEAIAAIDSGAESGLTQKHLPNISLASATLNNAMNRMGLDVIGSVTFGALSEGEMRLAMDTAVPRDLSPPELREWLVRKRDAQMKAADALYQAGLYLSTPGNTLAGWMEQNPPQQQQAPETQDNMGGPLDQPAPQGQPAAPPTDVTAPTSRAQYDALPSGARFQAPDGSIRIKP